MTDTASIQGLGTTPLGARRSSFATAREARAYASVSREGDSPENRKALQRLDRMLGSGRPLREDVPRGYYLNIRV